METQKNVVVLDRGNNTTCTVNLHGATIVSWRVNNLEQLFVSRLAVFDGKRHIRGGIPFVFPVYRRWRFGPQHGFARIMRWEVEKSPEKVEENDVEATFTIRDNEFTHAMWNYAFKITYTILLREKELHLKAIIENTSKEITFDCQILFHTYFKVPDVRKCEVTGLEGCSYRDRRGDCTDLFLDTEEKVTIRGWIDRSYYDTPDEHILMNAAGGRKMRIVKFNLPDTAVWNPWFGIGRFIQDLDDDEYSKMLCVESGRYGKPIVLKPGETYEAKAILQTTLYDDILDDLFPTLKRN